MCRGTSAPASLSLASCLSNHCLLNSEYTSARLRDHDTEEEGGEGEEGCLLSLCCCCCCWLCSCLSRSRGRIDSTRLSENGSRTMSCRPWNDNRAWLN